MNKFHSVTLDVAKCVGCTACLKRCPTEAIRIRERRARIIDERCIDCGECIRICEHHAKVATTNPLSAINRYPYKIALPAPALYGQFKNLQAAAAIPAPQRRPNAIWASVMRRMEPAEAFPAIMVRIITVSM